MLEITGDIWEHIGLSVIAITTSGSLTRDGRAVLGRGVAGQAANIVPGLAGTLGRLIGERGNHVFDLGSNLVSFPVEETAWSLPDLQIIGRSAQELASLANAAGWPRILVPRPGCGGGGLAWHDVKPVLGQWLDERFTVISWLP